MHDLKNNLDESQKYSITITLRMKERTDIYFGKWLKKLAIEFRVNRGEVKWINFINKRWWVQTMITLLIKLILT